MDAASAFASASVPSSASQYIHLNNNPNTCIDLRAETETDAAAGLIQDKNKVIVKSIRCNTSSRYVTDARAGAEEVADADRFPNILHSIYAHLSQQFRKHTNIRIG